MVLVGTLRVSKLKKSLCSELKVVYNEERQTRLLMTYETFNFALESLIASDGTNLGAVLSVCTRSGLGQTTC
jgi:hypothetical protein